jgi:hydroxyacylglutathione hydrolase
MSALRVQQFNCRTDNVGLLLHAPASGLTAAVDTPDPVAILSACTAAGWRLSHVFNTHHHHDHVSGNLALKEATGCTVVGAACDAARIPGIDAALADGESYDFGGHRLVLLETPGHTSGSVCWHLPDDRLLFTGDTLFSLGCGRLFEGTAERMWASLRRLIPLPDDTLIYCGHEYTVANAEFALEMEPGNAALRVRAEEARAARRQRRPTLPVSLGSEKACNPFLRPASAEIRRHLGLAEASDGQVFARLRQLKDDF